MKQKALLGDDDNQSLLHSFDRHSLPVMKRIKRILVAVLGGTVLVLGIALIVLPGPAFLLLPAGLAILAIEFAWAGRWLRQARAWLPGSGVRHQARPGTIPALATTPPKIP